MGAPGATDPLILGRNNESTSAKMSPLGVLKSQDCWRVVFSWSYRSRTSVEATVQAFSISPLKASTIDCWSANSGEPTRPPLTSEL